MFYIALCDDERADLEAHIEQLSKLKQQKYQIEYVCYTNGYELVAAYEAGRKFDLLILDMVMDEINGIETAKKIRQYDNDVPILIVTATASFALDGYKVGAYRYILKPVQPEDFLSQVKYILDFKAREKKQYFSFTGDNGVTKLKTRDIYYFESDARTIKIAAKSGSYYFVGKISAIDEEMGCYNFFRVHKSFVVNFAHISNIYKDTITLDTGDTLPLSKHRSKELHQAFFAYIKESV